MSGSLLINSLMEAGRPNFGKSKNLNFGKSKNLNFGKSKNLNFWKIQKFGLPASIRLFINRVPFFSHFAIVFFSAYLSYTPPQKHGFTL